jgi:hypothetical protein
MDRKISEEQINQILQIVYGTNMPASQFDAFKKFLSDLPKAEEPKEDKKK